ncbi:MAG: FlgD immunoglobulin-like domain containing protein, partial [Candidatus Latescibacterota bacterium]
IHFTFHYVNDGIGLSWNMLGDTFDAKFDLHRIDTEPVRRDTILIADVQPVNPPSGYFTPFYVFDHSVTPGQKYLYYIEGTFTTHYRGKDTTITHISNEFDVTASLRIDKPNILSAPSPNPFRDQTLISVAVPSMQRQGDFQSSQAKGIPGGATKAPAIQDDVPTSININIYNALGQRIKRLHSGYSYSTVLTFKWDGTNDNNEKVPSGIYFLRATAGPYTQVKKVSIVR